VEIFEIKDIPKEEWYKAQCPSCEIEMIAQDQDICPGCNARIIWTNSRIWKREFGTPASYRRTYETVPPDDDDGVGWYLMQVSGVDGFANKTEKRRWDDARRYMSIGHLRSTVDRCYKKDSRGRGLIVHVLNSVAYVVRSKKVESKRRSAAESRNLGDVPVKGER
jgi:hypothetical protein